MLSAAAETPKRKPVAVRRVTEPLAAAVALRQHSTPAVEFECYLHVQDVGDLMRQGHRFTGGGDKEDKEACRPGPVAYAEIRHIVDDDALGGEVVFDLFNREIVGKVFDDVFDGSGGEEVDVCGFKVFDHLLVIQDVGCFD